MHYNYLLTIKDLAEKLAPMKQFLRRNRMEHEPLKAQTASLARLLESEADITRKPEEYQNTKHTHTEYNAHCIRCLDLYGASSTEMNNRYVNIKISPPQKNTRTDNLRNAPGVLRKCGSR